MRLLLIEDDRMIGESVQAGLRQDGFVVDWVRDAASASAAVATHSYGLVLLDLGLPGKGGLQWLREQRAKANDLPLLILTARDAVSDRVAGLDSGADDYLVKPFDLAELAARIRALLRRRTGRAHPQLRHAELTLDPRTHEVRLKGEPITVSAREFAVLAALMERPGAVLSRAQLEERLYGWGEEVGSNAIEVHIHHLRRKLGQDFIRNLRGMGYTLSAT